MHHKLSIFTLIISLLFTACGSSTSKDAGGTTGPLKIIGKIEYERVNPLHSGGTTQLDINNITTEKAREVVVQAVNRLGEVIASTTTDNNGDYTLTNLPENTYLKIRAYAKLFKKNRWDVKVIDNTNGGAEYVLEGSLVSTKTQSTRRNLKALASTKQSPPFAILDSIYSAMKKVDDADDSIVFPPLNLNWSPNNIEVGTYYDGDTNIMILGDQNGDSDEYDDHIMIHEWGHYFEAKFSRADSIGGGHISGNYLDIRLAFGEGWGNALSGIITDDPLYFDTKTHKSIRTGWNMNLESAKQESPGWFSEASIQRILYDLYDSNNDGADQLSLGFKPLYDVLVGPQKTTPAFTSIFSLITGLKSQNKGDIAQIDAIVANEGIRTITDIYGSNRNGSSVRAPTLPLYTPLTINTPLSGICVTNQYGITPTNEGVPNKLNTHKYIYFTINNTQDYGFKVEQSNGADSDPDFAIFQSSPFKQISLNNGSDKGVETATYNLPEGSYILDIHNANQTTKACFNISIEEK
jgi:hypothetical protein